MSKDSVTSLTIGQLLSLSDGTGYRIPIYQRNYAWGEPEIEQLVRDLADNANKGAGGHYYLGTLVVHSNTENEPYDVIDGQQRLTTLFLIASTLKRKTGNTQAMPTKGILTFECREKANQTLQAIREGHKENAENRDTGIRAGYQTIEGHLCHWLNDAGCDPDDFCKYLMDSTVILRVEVPKDADLNRYFEVMNTRGEQLEKHEVLKARLLNACDEKKRHGLSRIWDACAEMDRYVQLAFTPEERDALFGADWHTFSHEKLDELVSPLTNGECTQGTNADRPNLWDLAEGKAEGASNKEKRDKQDSGRFRAIIDFPNFLLQVLCVFVRKKEELPDDGLPLNDKSLIETFDQYILEKEDSAQRVKDFFYHLLKCRFLFDQYVIKREGDVQEGEWRLYRGHKEKSGLGYKKVFSEDQGNDVNRQILMLQSAFQVSSPSHSYKYWLHAAMVWLEDRKAEKGPIQGTEYLEYLESVAVSFVFDRYLKREKPLDYKKIIHDNKGVCQTGELTVDRGMLRYGEIRNNLIFNWLDYLLYLRDKESDTKIKQFRFKYRSSVEHYYPQNPIGEQQLSEDCLHDFGNLCLISHSKNAKLSNYSPEAKMEHYGKQSDIDSIKQYLMMKKTKAKGWGQEQIKSHYDEMKEVLETESGKIRRRQAQNSASGGGS